MSDLFDLADIEPPTDLRGWVSLEIAVRFPDGTSSLYFRDIEREDDIPEATEWILDHDMTQRIDRLSPDDRDMYFEYYDPERSDAIEWSISGCTCHSACFCYDVLTERRHDVKGEAFAWLAENARPGAIVTWRWRPFHAAGTAIITDRSIDFAFAEIVLATNESGEATELADPIALLHL